MTEYLATKVATGNLAFDLGIILFFIFLNGFFVLSEFALVSATAIKIKALKVPKFIRNLSMKQLKEIDLYLASCQLGITIASLALGWLGEPILAKILSKFLHDLGPLKVFASHLFSFIISFTAITSMHIILGEQIPKLIAITSPEFYTILISLPLEIFTKIFYPFIKLLQVITAIVARILGLRLETESHGEIIPTPEELKVLLDEAQKRGIIAEEAGKMLKHILNLDNLTVLDVLVPRREVVAVPLGTRLETFLDIIDKYKHSRYPVYEGNIDNIVGILHVKDVIPMLRKGLTKIDKKILREPLFLPETMSLFEALKKMREKRMHLAIVLDEYGGTRGIVMIEDIIEYIVGELSDEFDVDLQRKIVKVDENTFLVLGNTSIIDLYELADIDLSPFKERYGNFSTVGGLVFNVLGRRPEKGDEIRVGEYVLTVESVRGPRVGWVRLKRETPEKDSE